MTGLLLLLAVLVPSPAEPHAWADAGLREEGRAYAAVDTPEVTTRLEGGRTIPPGGEFRSQAFQLSPGEYRLRLLDQGDTRVSDEDLAVEVLEAGGARSRWEHPLTSPPTVRVDRAGAYTVTVHNRSRRSVGVGSLAFLRRASRAPVQIVLLVPDAYAYFPEAHPAALYGRLRPAGTYHAAFYSAGDNTHSFTRTLFRRRIPSGEALGQALRRHGFLTATISDNFYVMADVEEHDFESAVVVRDSFTSDGEIADRAVEWARRREGEDFFLYVHLLADHGVAGVPSRTSTDEHLYAVVTALRAAAPQALVLVAPDHGPMSRHAWDAGRLSGGQGSGLYLDTQHIPLVAVGPGIRPGGTCTRRWSWADVRDLLGSAQAGATSSLVAALDCRGPDRDRIVVEGWRQQLAISDREFHYVSYERTVPYPMFTAPEGRLVRDRFLDQEALFDLRDDPDQERDVGASHVDHLLRYRLEARQERQARFGSAPAAAGVLRLLFLSRRCQPPSEVRLHADAPLVLEAATGPPVEALPAAAGALVLRWQQPSCFRDLRVRVTALNTLEIELPGGDLYLGEGFLHRSERARLDGANAIGLLRASPARGVGDAFVRNGAREGLYVFLEAWSDGGDGPVTPARREVGARGTNASSEEVRRMMRAWGYMHEAEAVP